MAGNKARWKGLLGTSGNRLLLALPLTVLAACSSEPSGGQLQLNEPGGITLKRPGFLFSKTLEESPLEARVSVDVGGVNYPASALNSTTDSTSWQGEVYVPEGSDATLNINWVETGVQGLPDGDDELLLATYTAEIGSIVVNQAVSVDIDDYIVESTEEDPRPELDLDEDGFGNLYERVAETDPNDFTETPPLVVIKYYPYRPRIDGHWDPQVWDEDNAQFENYQGGGLNIDNVLFDNDVVQVGEADRRYRWGAMHDGKFLYVMVFAEKSGDQTPYGDSIKIYDDDAIELFWDGDNSKGTHYDDDDFHAIISLLSTSSRTTTPNATGPGRTDTRFETGDYSADIDVSAFEFAVCLCESDGEQQVYEVKLDLEKAGIPINERFGLDVQLDNDVDGGARDAKWAWYNKTGEDDSWRYPSRLGTAILEDIR